MAEQKRKDTKSTKPQVEETVSPRTDLTKKGEHLKKAMDAMVDEIDEILEENAEEFVASYVQRGGQ